MNIILIGGPGSGKSTYSEIIKKDLDIEHIYPGELLRKEKAKGGEIAKRLSNLGKGGFAPNDIVLKLVFDAVEKAKESEFQIMTRPFGGAFNIKGKFGSPGDVVNYDYPVPLEFDEKTDIEIQVKAGATTAAGAIFDIVLLDNPRTMQVS